jgi:hypothetical protein
MLPSRHSGPGGSGWDRQRSEFLTVWRFCRSANVFFLPGPARPFLATANVQRLFRWKSIFTSTTDLAGAVCYLPGADRFLLCGAGLVGAVGYMGRANTTRAYPLSLLRPPLLKVSHGEGKTSRADRA